MKHTACEKGEIFFHRQYFFAYFLEKETSA